MLNPALKYYNLLGLQPGASMEEIKKAYRKYARQYHPDVNKSQGATDHFIRITEAYQFLTEGQKISARTAGNMNNFANYWENNRREDARRRAQAHARSRYSTFINSDLYKSTKILDKTRSLISLVFSLLIIFMAIYGYIFRLRMTHQGLEKPSLSGFLFLLSIGLTFMGVSLLFLYNNHYKNRKKTDKNEKKDT